jgi:hypothetical protein
VTQWQGAWQQAMCRLMRKVEQQEAAEAIAILDKIADRQEGKGNGNH